VRWEDAAHDDFVGELQGEQAFNDQEAGNTKGVYNSLQSQVDGAGGAEQFASLDSSHASVYDDVTSTGTRAISGMLDAGDTQNAARSSAIAQLNG
jgi:hypothetical protein